MATVLVSEVAPRDGLQSVAATMPTAAKHRWIAAMAAAGLQEIEVGSFVPARLLPQLADTGEVVRQAIAIPGVRIMALVPNLRGAQAAYEAGAHKITIPVSVSEAHSLANVRKTHAQMIEEVRSIVAWRDEHCRGLHIESGLATAFGCTISGAVPEDDVVRMAARMAAIGADDIGLADTTGYGNPAQVRRLFTRVRAEVGDRLGSAHFHNTRGQGLANVVAALDVGVTTFDASLGGIGGCPYAPGASGNIVTEDLVFLLEAMGLDTGIDLERLLEARNLLAAALPGEPLYGHLAGAGLPKGFRYADGRAPQASARVAACASLQGASLGESCS